MEESFLFLLLSYALTPALSQKGEGVTYKLLAHCSASCLLTNPPTRLEFNHHDRRTCIHAR